MPAALRQLAAFDRSCMRRERVRLAGVDEAGRGSWAGPVVAAAVILPVGWCPDDLDDSKRLTANQREQLYALIRSAAISWGACAVSAPEIDSTNILAATLRAMALAIGRLDPAPDLVLVDGLQVPQVDCETRALVKGDATSAAIAAASIVAKVLRDRVMTVWGRRLPGYGFADHKGYGAPRHREALQRLGPCRLHRLSYKPVAAVAQSSLWRNSSPRNETC